ASPLFRLHDWLPVDGRRPPCAATGVQIGCQLDERRSVFCRSTRTNRSIRPNCYTLSHVVISSVSLPVLSMRGSLCWPPNLPFDFIHSAKPPERTASTSGGPRLIDPTR